ncbi:MAG: biopolymer transporter ExbD [Verrucomicrobiales bacterium]|nr:biopolymer transporter ExbD [Verrucomicrobiales bacterium]
MPLRRHSDRHPLSSLSELNVTPLIDLAFVLLVIFMITAPLLRQGMEVAVPATKTSQESVPPGNTATLTINAAQALTLNGKPVEYGGIAAALTALRQEHPQLAVVVEAHRDLPVQTFVEIMEAVKSAGVARISILTRPEVP